MPFRARTAIFRWSLHSVPYSIHHHQPHSLHSSSSSILLKFTSLAQPQVNGKSVETCDDDGFLSWLERKAGCRISSSLSIGKSSYGRSLFASKAIKTGDCILKVPYRVQITADNLPAKIKSLISEEVANVAKLAVLLLIERKLGQLACMSEISLSVCRTLSGILISAVYHGKRSCITRQIFWNESELEMIHRSSVYWETINQKSQIERDFLAIRPIFECFSQSFGDITYKDFMYACTLDFVNHDGNSEAIVMSDDDKQLSEVISDRDYAPGEQVLIRYGKFSNATLMLDFGFTVPYNIYDQVQIQLDIPKHDPLHKMKLELMQQYFVPSRKNAENLKHSWNIFTIKEVKWPKGKGKGLPQSLRAFARVLSCTNRQELDDLVVEAAQTDGRLGRRPLPDVNKEIQAHLMLSSLIGKLIEERSAAIMSLEESSNCSSFCVRVPVRRFMARDLLRGELRILNSAFTWLENYCLSST
ncbi:ribulose-1,5 bisphosphate carboxylase/oxygenase large subunit N-methyltransferase, chloroplastic isoform X3 [Arachis hypogaea]|uniref:ribulose-1,5 bisphosphate carboxylase/oxygenase large subunit N-methyltransferase, chloroplastic isoform X3 n=1 Tax=Arachis hypogaea TaxID=3818 RepID=UPI0011056FF5|nr:uncharacterized protein LOC112779652 isoform X3 [Arachis hypogaea]